MADWKGKRTFVPPSSSSEEDDYGYVEEEYGYGYAEEEYGYVDEDDDGDENEDEDDDDGESISNSSENRSYSRDGEEEEAYDDNDGSNNGDQDGVGDQEYLCNTVIRFLQEGNDLRALNLKECKAYLRMNGLRVTGIKEDCIQRIKKDWRMKIKKENRNIKKTQKRCDHSSGTICRTKGERYNGEIMKTETRYLQSSETCQTCGTTGYKVELHHHVIKTPTKKQDDKHKCGPRGTKAPAKRKTGGTQVIKAPPAKRPRLTKTPAKRKTGTQVKRAPATKRPRATKAPAAEHNVIFNNIYFK